MQGQMNFQYNVYKKKNIYSFLKLNIMLLQNNWLLLHFIYILYVINKNTYEILIIY